MLASRKNLLFPERQTQQRESHIRESRWVAPPNSGAKIPHRGVKPAADDFDGKAGIPMLGNDVGHRRDEEQRR
jgi:hypothetical protein